jgi:hypothetical protein
MSMSAIEDLLSSADPTLVTDCFMKGAIPLPEPPHLTAFEAWLMRWCPPALLPNRVAEKAERREQWDNGEAPRFRWPMPPRKEFEVIRWRRPIDFVPGE